MNLIEYQLVFNSNIYIRIKIGSFSSEKLGFIKNIFNQFHLNLAVLQVYQTHYLQYLIL